MGRYDKYEPKGGGFRAPLNADTAANEATNGVGVGLNASGRVVAGPGATGVIGMLVLTKAKKAGDIVDVMTDGEMVDCTGLAAGTVYYANTTTGALETAAPAAGSNKTRVGYTVESTRLVVRCEITQG